MTEINKYIPFSKIDPDKRMVYGYASTPELDSQGEIVSVEGLKKALPSYMAFPTIREMHAPKAAGVTKEAVTSEKGLYIGAKIVADEAWRMVKEGVYRGFSIGGRVKKKVQDTIEELDLTEISLVDVPANRGSVFTLVKREGENLVNKQATTDLGIPQFIREQHEMLETHKTNFGKEVTENMPKENELPKEEVLEDTPQESDLETPKVPTEEKEETAEVKNDEVSEESPDGKVEVDEVKESVDDDLDIAKRLDKLEASQKTAKPVEENTDMTKVMAKLDNQFAKVVSVLEGLEERVAKVESMAAPVKVSKSYLVDKSVVSESSTIAKQEARLKELEKIRDADLARYQRENMQKEAFEVLDQIKELKKLDERG